VNPPTTGYAHPPSYLEGLRESARIEWPANRTLTVVCHGHSVPAGYFKTPEVRTFESYPHLLHRGLKDHYPHAVFNVTVTAIGGETSPAGAERFEHDVLPLRPDVLTLDYGLNDRRVGLESSLKAWRSMIETALARNIRIILLTPSPDLASNLSDPADPLNRHADQIRGLARDYGIGLSDSLAAFLDAARDGKDPASLMSQGNHPNHAGHQLIARRLLEWFV
jgi:acyl-CoA thioesterase I